MGKLIAKYGWKTVTGSIALAIGQLLKLSPDTEPYAPIADAVGVALGGVGLRCAIANISEAKPDA